MREPDKSRKSPWWRVRAACTALGRDRDGSVFFYTTLALPVLVGFAVLAIDGSRLMNLHSHLQHAADGLALAAAGELDRKPDSCVRAVRALTNLVENEQRFGTAGAAIVTMADVSYRFIETLPISDHMPIEDHFGEECDEDENEAARARYIEVTVDPQTLTTLMPAAFIGGSDTATANATAVAGFDAAVCDFTPLFICNPFNQPIAQALQNKANLGRQIKFHNVPADCDETCSSTPGNFGVLETPTSGKNKDIKHMLATASPGACFLQNSVTTKPGESGIGPWLNVRFDLYEGSANKLGNTKGYGPAKNVRKGYDGDKCAQLKEQVPPVTALGRDEVFTGSLGNGQWDFEAYWEANFPGEELPDEPGEVKPGEEVKKWDNVNLPTRYAVYKYELANFDKYVKLGVEKGAPMCATPEPDGDRRILYAAVLDCGSDKEIKGKYTGQAEGFVEMFLTEPADHEPGKGPATIWVEITDLVEPGNQTSVARDRVQLYR